MLRDAVATFAQNEIKPLVREMDENSQVDPDLLKSMFEHGLMGIEIDEEYGGAGMSFVSSLIAIEELSKVDAAVAVIADIQNTLSNTAFRTWGTKAQQAHYLSRFATDTICSFCLSEAGSGSDAFALKTKADKVGDDRYVLNGNKLWISQAREAGVFVVFANVDFDQKHRGITAFIVEADNPGIKVGKKEDKLGIRASSTCEVILDNCEVSADCVLGNVGEGYKIAIGLLNEGRIGIAAQMVGLAQGAFNAVMPYLHERKQFGQPIADFQGMRFQYAQLDTEIQAARLLTYNAARLRDAGLPFIKEAAQAKLYTSQVAEKSASRAIEWMGGVGYTKEFPVEKFYRDAKIGAIYEGTSNLQLETIAKLVQQDFK